MKKDTTSKMTGMWRSIITYRDPKTGEETKTVTAWEDNLVVDNGYVLQAMLFKNELSIAGLQYMAFGEGDPSWDPVPPSPSASDSTLFSEVFRYELQTANFVYLDASLSVVAGPTRRIRMTGILDYGDAVGDYIREFGLFGGDATATVDSGYMINTIRTERFLKTGAIRLERQVILGMGLA